MDDGSAKCLLDVISDPNALQEFLRSNSQDHSIHPKTSTPGAVAQSDFGNHLANPPLLNTSGLRTSNVTSGFAANAKFSAAGSGNINSTAFPQSSFINAVANNSATRTSGSSTISHNVGVVPSSVPVLSGQSFLKASAVENALNKGGSSVLGMSLTPSVPVNKSVVTSTVTFQGKKPIPIQPKTPNASSPATNSTASSPGNRTRQVVNSGIPLVTQKQSVSGPQSTSTVSQRVVLNGVESKANVKANTVNAGIFHTTKSPSLANSQPVLSTTPVKRIAPKQPSVVTQSGLSSPPQMAGSQHKILLQQMSNQTVPKVQTVVNQVSTGTVQQANHTQLVQAQQLLNLIRGQNSTNQTTQQASPQFVQSTQSLPANQIKQIQQLVQQKLSNQQQQLQVVQSVQHKVLTPSQLQAALKQNQQLTVQTAQATQPQNIVVQEEVVKQLLQQAAQQKSAPNLAQQQPQIFQQIQQPVQKQILVQNIQPQSTLQGQQTAQLSQISNVNRKLKTEVVPAPVVNVQLQQVMNNQQKQIQQVLGQQQVNLLPQQNLVITKDQGARLLQSVTFVQNQPNSHSTAQVVNQGNVVHQAKPVVQHSQAGTEPLVQVVTTAQSNTVPQTQQQQTQNTGVQKVFIIKQPELLQKLGLQGAKTQQTIQITSQQLQALKQLQLQQQSAKQKLMVNNLQTGTNVQAKGLTSDQLKQLQLQQQAQGLAVKQVVVQSRAQQPILQQQRQINVKTQQGKMQHIPRILQKSGRQPVSQVKVSVPVKQETSKGVKRPHSSSDTTETPKVVTRLKQGLTQDQQAVLRPDLKTPFTSHEDIVKRLAPYHVCYDQSPTPDDVEKAEGLFSSVSSQLVKRSQKMMEKHRQLLFDESMREHPSAEMVMLYRVFLTNERAALAEERKKAKEDPQEFLNFIKETTNEKNLSNGASSAETSKDYVSSKHQTSIVTSETDDDFVTRMKSTVSEASSKISSLLKVDTTTAIKNSHTNSLSSKTDIALESSSHSKRTHSSLVASCTNNCPRDSPPQKIHQSNKQTSQPFEKAVTNLTADSVTREESSLDVPMDTEAEKEDVTATLALLNSMASELDEVLDVEGTL